MAVGSAVGIAVVVGRSVLFGCGTHVGRACGAAPVLEVGCGVCAVLGTQVGRAEGDVLAVEAGAAL